MVEQLSSCNENQHTVLLVDFALMDYYLKHSQKGDCASALSVITPDRDKATTS